MARLCFLIFSIFILNACSSVSSCKTGIVSYKINVSNVDNFIYEDTTLKNYTISLIDSVIPGFKCKFY